MHTVTVYVGQVNNHQCVGKERATLPPPLSPSATRKKSVGKGMGAGGGLEMCKAS